MCVYVTIRKILSQRSLIVSLSILISKLCSADFVCLIKENMQKYLKYIQSNHALPNYSKIIKKGDFV